VDPEGILGSQRGPQSRRGVRMRIDGRRRLVSKLMAGGSLVHDDQAGQKKGKRDRGIGRCTAGVPSAGG
jgi:hypothetical protein